MKYITNNLIPSGAELKRDKSSKLAQLLRLVTSLVVILGFIYALRDYFSNSIQVMISIILILCLIIMIYIAFFDMIYSSYKQMQLNRMRNEVARNCFPELILLIEKFEKLVNTNDSIIQVFNKLRSEEENFKYLRVPQLNRIENLIINLNQAINSCKRNADNLELLIKQFENVIDIYNEFYINSILDEINDIIRMRKIEATPKNVIVPERIKDQYEASTDKYKKFLDKYVDFGERINKEYHGRIIRTYSDELKKI